MTPVLMSKTKARGMARRQTAYGYFHVSGVERWVHCPVCRERIHGYAVAWATPGQWTRTMVAALVAHLTEECGSPDFAVMAETS